MIDSVYQNTRCDILQVDTTAPWLMLALLVVFAIGCMCNW
jgi:hypothetical protein